MKENKLSQYIKERIKWYTQEIKDMKEDEGYHPHAERKLLIKEKEDLKYTLALLNKIKSLLQPIPEEKLDKFVEEHVRKITPDNLMETVIYVFNKEALKNILKAYEALREEG